MFREIAEMYLDEHEVRDFVRWLEAELDLPGGLRLSTRETLGIACSEFIGDCPEIAAWLDDWQLLESLAVRWARDHKEAVKQLYVDRLMKLVKEQVSG